MKRNGILFHCSQQHSGGCTTASFRSPPAALRQQRGRFCGSRFRFNSSVTHLRLAYRLAVRRVTLYIAGERLLRRENLEVEQVTVDAARLPKAVNSDRVDVGMGLIGKMHSSRSRTACRSSLPPAYTPAASKLLVPADSGIKTVTDLKGKNIGVPGLADAGGRNQKVRCLRSERRYDASESSSEVTFTVFSRNDLAQALQNKAVDAIVLGDPQASITQEQYGLTALIDTATDPDYKDEYCCMAFKSANKLAGKVRRLLPLCSPVRCRRLPSGFRRIRTRLQRSSLIKVCFR